MLICPRCSFRMVQHKQENITLDRCSRCQGVFLEGDKALDGFGFDLKKLKDLPTTVSLGPTRMTCPNHDKKLLGYKLKWDETKVELEHCDSCLGLFIDSWEIRKLKKISESSSKDLEDKDKEPIEEDDDTPGILWYIFQVLTGLPVESWNPVRIWPVAVYSLLGAVALLFGLQQFVLMNSGAESFQQIFVNFGLIPNVVTTGGNLYTLLTHAFLHGSWMHLLGNMYFLYVFGDNVEDALGPWKFIALYVLAALGGAALHAAIDTGSGVPMIGASGAIAGLMGAYMVLFPKVKVWVIFYLIRFKLGVIWYLAFWIGLQLLNGFMMKPNVAWFAHVGGFAVGALFALLVKGTIEPAKLGKENPSLG